jgi:hypothetical protein
MHARIVTPFGSHVYVFYTTPVTCRDEPYSAQGVVKVLYVD